MSNNIQRPALTMHARDRWDERCAGLDPDAEWYCSRRAGKSVRKQIRASCPGHAALLVGRDYRGFWYMVSRNRVVFVVDARVNAIVTVWRLIAKHQPAQAAA